jgi:hypothetical protein
LDPDVSWVYWPAGRADVLRCLVPISGIVFYSKWSDGRWARFGSRLPTTDAPPDGPGEPLHPILFPARIEPVPPDTDLFPPLPLRLVRGGEPKPATMLSTSMNRLAAWADGATTLELAAVRAARCGNRVLLFGLKLPSLAESTRFWGTDLLLPVGFRTDPDLPAPIVQAAVGVSPDELMAFDETGIDLVPRSAFEPLTRAGIRLAVREGVA